LIDQNVDLAPPELTGNALLDKKLLSSYSSQLTAAQKNVTTLFENGIINAEEAENRLQYLEGIKAAVKAATAKPKKGRKPPKLVVPKARKVSIPKAKISKPKTYKIVKPAKRTVKRIPRWTAPRV
jgi:hypothetical protein